MWACLKILSMAPIDNFNEMGKMMNQWNGSRQDEIFAIGSDRTYNVEGGTTV